jgi:hypothetical protein
MVVCQRGLPTPVNSWAAALLILVAALCGSPDAMSTEIKRVLFLHSFGRDSSPYDATVAAIRSQLAHDSAVPLAIFDASLDAGQAREADDRQPFVELLRHRLAATPPDAVVTIGPPAAVFFLQNRDKLFPAVPAVIGALDVRLVPNGLLRSGDAVVASRHNLPAAVDNILQVLPRTARIVVVLGDSPLERYWFGELSREFLRFGNRVSFEWLNKLSFAQTRERVAALPPNSAVLYTFLLTDAAGVPYERRAALAGLAEVSTAPIFSVYESELGHGVVGGPYQSQQRRGAMTAAAVLRALSGILPVPRRFR